MLVVWTHAPTRRRRRLRHWREGKEITHEAIKGIVIIRKRWNVVKGLQRGFCVGTQIVNSLQKTSETVCKASDAKGEEQKEARLEP